MPLPSTTTAAFQALEAYFLKDADVVSAHLTRHAAPARFEGALVIMDQDDDGRPCLTEPLDWRQSGFQDVPSGAALRTAQQALNQAAQDPAAQDDLATRFPEGQATVVGIEDVRRWLAEAEPAPATRSRRRPR